MPRQPTPLARIVAADATLALWEARRTRDDALTRLVRRQLPRLLAPHLRVADVRGACLELVADGGAAAAAARQRTPDIIAALQHEGMQFTSLRVRVQVRSAVEQPVKIQQNQQDRPDVRTLQTLAARLPPGPLRDAVGRLARRLR